MFFKRKPQLSRQDSLAARPVRLVDVEPVDAGDGVWRITVPLRPPRVARWLAPGMAPRSKTFEFDDIGQWVWTQLDGKSTVEQLIRRLAEKHKLDLRQAETATVSFLQTLARRGLVGFGVDNTKK
jgi:hypothetical protein